MSFLPRIPPVAVDSGHRLSWAAWRRPASFHCACPVDKGSSDHFRCGGRRSVGQFFLPCIDLLHSSEAPRKDGLARPTRRWGRMIGECHVGGHGCHSGAFSGGAAVGHFFHLRERLTRKHSTVGVPAAIVVRGFALCKRAMLCSTLTMHGEGGSCATEWNAGD